MLCATFQQQNGVAISMNGHEEIRTSRPAKFYFIKTVSVNLENFKSLDISIAHVIVRKCWKEEAGYYKRERWVRRPQIVVEHGTRQCMLLDCIWEQNCSSGGLVVDMGCTPVCAPPSSVAIINQGEPTFQFEWSFGSHILSRKKASASIKGQYLK